MRLLLIRHGESENNVIEGNSDYAARRQPDPSLTPLGRQQAEHLAAALRQVQSVTHLATSLMARAVQTAAPLAEALRLPVQGIALAYEYGGLTTGPAGGFTPVAGRDHASLRAECPGLVWPEDLNGQRWNGGAEAWDEAVFASRAARVLSELRALGDEESTVALVSHHDFIGALLRAALWTRGGNGGPLFRLPHASTTVLDWQQSGSATLHWLSRVDHLPPELVTS